MCLCPARPPGCPLEPPQWIRSQSSAREARLDRDYDAHAVSDLLLEHRLEEGERWEEDFLLAGKHGQPADVGTHLHRVVDLDAQQQRRLAARVPCHHREVGGRAHAAELDAALEHELISHGAVAHAAPQIACLELEHRHVLGAQLLERPVDEQRRETVRVRLLAGSQRPVDQPEGARGVEAERCDLGVRQLGVLRLIFLGEIFEALAVVPRVALCLAAVVASDLLLDGWLVKHIGEVALQLEPKVFSSTLPPQLQETTYIQLNLHDPLKTDLVPELEQWFWENHQK